MTNADYVYVATNVLPRPANLGAAATIVVGMMADQITKKNRLHTEAKCVYRTYHNVDQAFKKLSPTRLKIHTLTRFRMRSQVMPIARHFNLFLTF
jgi:hypothetical protein